MQITKKLATCLTGISLLSINHTQDPVFASAEDPELMSILAENKQLREDIHYTKEDLARLALQAEEEKNPWHWNEFQKKGC